ncbi:MAG: hypothetical protein F6K09_13955 [Merismopedia sp. SIO2A8]|nr:hypothetical protein [Merismopedia sp. SIO2A8]
MGQQDKFVGGFLLGTLIGGVVGGIVGVLASSRLPSDVASLDDEPEQDDSLSNGNRPFPLPTERSIEVARRSLEDKIAQLNDAIDDVRQQLSTVNESNGDAVNSD